MDDARPHAPRLARVLLAALPALALTTAAARAQEAPPDLPPPREPAAPAEDLLLASDGAPAAPGRVPADTSEAARRLWTQLAGSLSVDDGTPAADAPRAFEFEFDVRHRQSSGTQNFSARLRYLDEGPGLVRCEVLDDRGAERSAQMRGVDERGRPLYWFRKVQGEGRTDGWRALRGRDTATSREEIDGWAAVAYDIARLTRPSSLRILSLRERAPLPALDGDSPLRLRFEGDQGGLLLPAVDIEGVREGRAQQVHELCAGLRWLEVRTMDFRDLEDRGPGADPRYRLVFGMDPTSGRPRVVVVSPSSQGPLQAPGTILAQCTEWLVHPAGAEPADASWMPGRFFAYESVLGPDGLRFSNVPRVDLYFIDGNMRARLQRSDFAPE